jgi:hypothetical protein
MTGTDAATYTRERPGMSAFVLEDGVVYHTNSTYARGLDGLWGMYQWLDRKNHSLPKPECESRSALRVLIATTRHSVHCRLCPYLSSLELSLSF